MKRIALLVVLVIGLTATSAARFQQPTTKAAPSRPSPNDSVSYKPSPELQKSLDDLAAAVHALAAKIASDPEIKARARQVAVGLVTTAEQVVAEQSVAIQGALKTAAERISAAQSIPERHSKRP